MPATRTTGTTKPRATAAQIDALTEKTSGAYSFDRFKNWRGVISMLLRRGFTEREVEAIALSKWTRWAADQSTFHGKRYGQATSADLARFLDHNRTPEVLAREVAELTLEHFGAAEEPVA